MSYINESLSKDEAVIELYKLHWFSKVMLWALSTFSIFFLLLLFTAILIYSPVINLMFTFFSVFFSLAIYEWFRLKSIEYGVTNKRVISKKGIVSRNTEEMKISSIETIEINQSVLGRLFGYGTIKITGLGISNLIYKYIDNPMEVKKSIEGVNETQLVNAV